MQAGLRTLSLRRRHRRYRRTMRRRQPKNGRRMRCRLPQRSGQCTAGGSQQRVVRAVAANVDRGYVFQPAVPDAVHAKYAVRAKYQFPAIFKLSAYALSAPACTITAHHSAGSPHGAVGPCRCRGDRGWSGGGVLVDAQKAAQVKRSCFSGENGFSTLFSG